LVERGQRERVVQHDVAAVHRTVECAGLSLSADHRWHTRLSPNGALRGARLRCVWICCMLHDGIMRDGCLPFGRSLRPSMQCNAHVRESS
jgi:hypothetical protein